MKAFDFEYDGRCLRDYGMMICSLDYKGIDTVSNGAEISFNTVSTLGGSKHELVSTEYEDCLETTIQICKYSCSTDIEEITPVEFRELTKWLNRKKFLKFKPLSKEYIDLYFEASFNISRIEINGKIIGLELEVFTNRPFALHEPKIINIETNKRYTWEKFYVINDTEKGETTGEFVTSFDINLYPNDGVKIYKIEECESEEYGNIKGNYYYVLKEEVENIASFNDSSYEEGYIYPYTEITILEDGDLNIHNVLENRNTYIANCSAGEVITMDYPIIKTDNDSHKIQNDFNWNFFRVANTFENSRNDLITSIPCSIKIKYSPIVKVGL